MTSRQHGWTIIEVLVVLIIVAIISALLYPTFAISRRAAMQTTAISNLKQCSYRLLIYMSDAESSVLPNYASIKHELNDAPIFDPADDTRFPFYGKDAPMIGSYAYIRGVRSFSENWDDSKTWAAVSNELPAIHPFVSTHNASPRRIIHHFDDQQCVGNFSCYFPSRIVRSRLDGSVQVKIYQTNYGPEKSHLLFTWAAAFSVP